MTRIVAIDIGGTNARFTIAEIGDNTAITLGETVTLHTSDYASFQTAWEAYSADQKDKLPPACAISIAGPIGGDVIHFTNNPWIIRPALIPEKLGVERFTLVNDFGAVGHAVARMSDCDFIHLCGPDEPLPADGTLTIVGPGTGLGVAHLWRDGTGGYRVQATEGGHIDFAPLDSIEDAILARLRQRYRRVSVERVVAGPAIVDIYETLAALEAKAIQLADDKAIWTAATMGEDSLAAAAAERFCLSLGSVAGDLALAQGASGVVIAGGLGLRIRDTLLGSGFAQRFRAKGRFEALMAELPVKIITHPQPGLFGAAAAFAQEHPA
ncbi:MAG: glucokinase [Novosphingobium sp.]